MTIRSRLIRCGQLAILLSTMLSLGMHGRPHHISPVVPQMPLQGSSAFVAAEVWMQAKHGPVEIIVSGQDSADVARAVTAAGGLVTDELWLIDSVVALADASTIQKLHVQPGLRSITLNQQVNQSEHILPSQTKKQDINPLAKLTTNYAWPMVMDIGANDLHQHGIKGDGVAVAIIDSGVFFSPDLLANFAYQDMLNFLGQASFADKGICPKKIPSDTSIQYDGYCFQNALYSTDRFGHGSHVAGIIGNRYVDANSGISLGVAPNAGILSVRVLGDDGVGTYASVINGIQYVVQNKDVFNIRVMNLSLSALATVPYFLDPLNRAVEKAWKAGIVVVVAAGNEGPNAQTITVPGNDPYVITVGSLNSNRTAGISSWVDDTLPTYSATGPTLDGFIKPDVLAPGSSIVSFMYNNPNNKRDTAALALAHPDYSADMNLFRMSGTSMATAVTSGMAALMLQKQPNLTPDQVKFRMQLTARPALVGDALAYSPLQQGTGRIWAPDAVWNTFAGSDTANATMNLTADLQYGMQASDLAFHYQGPVQRMLSDQQNVTLYFIRDSNGKLMALGAVNDKHEWLTRAQLDAMNVTWLQGSLTWPAGSMISNSGGYAWNGGGYAWNGGGYAWNGGGYTWNGGGYAWNGGGYAWNGGGYAWNGGGYSWNGGGYSWNGSIDSTTLESTRWVDDK